jgi:hypothetical protein
MLRSTSTRRLRRSRRAASVRDQFVFPTLDAMKPRRIWFTQIPSVCVNSICANYD